MTCEHPKFELQFKNPRLTAYMAKQIMHVYCVYVLKIYLRKGPLERVPFPTLSHTQSPFQQLGHHLLLLGKKIDAAQLTKDHVLNVCLHEILLQPHACLKEKLEPHSSDKKAAECGPQSTCD